ncbi:MAG: DsbA family protein [Anaerolineales bacterium]|nr:DsbA family protein [Anaerolineales bacterium]
MSRLGLGLFAALAIGLTACAGVVTPTRAPAPTLARSFAPMGRTQGNPDARVTLVVYADFQCPYSRQFARQVLPRLVADYIAPGKISFTYKYFPVLDEGRIGESHWAAYAAECANDQARFWEYHDKLYAEQLGVNVGAFTRDWLKRYAADLKLDSTRFAQCLDTDRHATLVLEHLIEALQIKLPGTPTFLLNGRKIETPTLDYAEFWKPLEAELKAR